MRIKKLTQWTDNRRPEIEIERMLEALNMCKADRNAKLFTKIALNDLEEREGALLYDDTGLYRVYRFRNKLYKQKFEEL